MAEFVGFGREIYSPIIGKLPIRKSAQVKTANISLPRDVPVDVAKCINILKAACSGLSVEGQDYVGCAERVATWQKATGKNLFVGCERVMPPDVNVTAYGTRAQRAEENYESGATVQVPDDVRKCAGIIELYYSPDQRSTRGRNVSQQEVSRCINVVEEWQKKTGTVIVNPYLYKVVPGAEPVIEEAGPADEAMPTTDEEYYEEEEMIEEEPSSKKFFKVVGIVALGLIALKVIFS